ncbi:MAG: cytochrome c peroxidase [Sandaracinaceae bacterium]
MAIDRTTTGALLVLALGACASEPIDRETELASLGESLFHDTNLSANRTQSCATCHDPERAFTDGRTDNGRVRAVSLGDDGASLGDRNAPTATYAAFITPTALTDGTRRRFNRHEGNRLYEGPLGGLFHDGRAVGLEGQAAGPPLNPIEMGMPSRDAVVARLLGDPGYEGSFRSLFGDAVFDDPSAAYDAMTEAIAAFERTETFAPFDSKYDRILAGDEQFSFMELTGRSLFFSEFTNCSICHQLHGSSDPSNRTRETFSGYEFHNIGVPVNTEIRALNGTTEADLGLASNAAYDAPEHRGRFRVPTLRNVAVTGPYMHNGVFRSLRTTIVFYLHFIDPEGHPNNPETGEPWREAEVPETFAMDLLRVGRPLSELEIDSLVCFLQTLTDRRYEPLLSDTSASCAD